MAKKITDKEIDDITKKTGEELKDSDKVRIKIPMDKINKSETQVVVGINGFNYIIKKGETVSVPNEVAKILENAGYI